MTLTGEKAAHMLLLTLIHSSPFDQSFTCTFLYESVFFAASLLTGWVCIFLTKNNNIGEWIPVVNFTNIFWAAFARISFWQKITNPICKHFCTKKLLLKRWRKRPLDTSLMTPRRGNYPKLEKNFIIALFETATCHGLKLPTYNRVNSDNG